MYRQENEVRRCYITFLKSASSDWQRWNSDIDFYGPNRCVFQGHHAGKETSSESRWELFCRGLGLRGEPKEMAVAAQTHTSWRWLSLCLTFSAVFRYVAPGITLTSAGDTSSSQNSSAVLILKASFSTLMCQKPELPGGPQSIRTNQGSSAHRRGPCHAKPSPALLLPNGGTCWCHAGRDALRGLPRALLSSSAFVAGTAEAGVWKSPPFHFHSFPSPRVMCVCVCVRERERERERTDFFPSPDKTI